MVSLMHSADKDSVRLQAAVFIVERAPGKSMERHEVTHPLDDESTEALLEIKAILDERRAARHAAVTVEP